MNPPRSRVMPEGWQLSRQDSRLWSWVATAPDGSSFCFSSAAGAVEYAWRHAAQFLGHSAKAEGGL